MLLVHGTLHPLPGCGQGDLKPFSGPFGSLCPTPSSSPHLQLGWWARRCKWIFQVQWGISEPFPPVVAAGDSEDGFVAPGATRGVMGVIPHVCCDATSTADRQIT